MSRPLKIAFLTVDDRFTSIEELPRFGAAPTALLQGFEALGDEIEVHVICCTMGRQPSSAKLAPNVWYHGRPVPKYGYLRSLHVGCALAIRSILAEIEPDIVHAQGTERWCAVAGLLNGHPKVLTIHGNLDVIDPLMRMRPRTYWKLQTWLQKVTLPRYDSVFCNSDYTEQCLRPKAKQTWLVPNPLRSTFFQPSTGHAAQPDPAIILNVGIFQSRKRQLNLLHLAKRLWQHGSRVRFRFIGGLGKDDYGRQCRLLLDEGERYGFAEYGGLKTAQQMVEEMDRAHALIHCPEEEAFGLVVGEALARGLKFFGTAVGGILDITAGTHACCLHQIDDWDVLAQVIDEWVCSGAPRVPENAELMRQRYAPEVIAARHLEIYHTLLENRRR